MVYLDSNKEQMGGMLLKRGEHVLEKKETGASKWENMSN